MQAKSRMSGWGVGWVGYLVIVRLRNLGGEEDGRAGKIRIEASSHAFL